MVLCREMSLYKLNEIAEVFGNVTYSTVSATINRARSEYGVDDHIQTIKNELLIDVCKNKCEVKS